MKVDYTVTETNIHINDSYQYPKEKFEPILKDIQEEHQDLLVWERSMGSMRREWATHNLAYNWGIATERTGSVDLNVPQKWYVKLFYGVVGSIALLLIK